MKMSSDFWEFNPMFTLVELLYDNGLFIILATISTVLIMPVRIEVQLTPINNFDVDNDNGDDRDLNNSQEPHPDVLAN